MAAGVHSHRPDRSAPKPFKGRSKGRAKKRLKGRCDPVSTVSSSTVALGTTGKPLKYSSRAVLPGSCPRLVALLPCHALVDARAARNALLVAAGATPDQLSANGPVTVAKFTFIEASRDAFSMLDAAKVADIVVPIVCPRSTTLLSDAFGMDEQGEEFMAMMMAQGLPSCVILSQGVDLKTSTLLKKTCTRFMHTLVPDKPKIVAVEYGLDVIRCLSSISLRGLQWRDRRPYLLSDSSVISSMTDDNCASVILQGFLRGRQQVLSPDSLVHITGYGDFQVDLIEVGDEQFHADPMARQSLDGLCELGMLSNEQSIITEQELAECDEEARIRRQTERKEALMASGGLTDAQATWESILSDSDDDNGAMMAVDAPPASQEGADHIAMTLKFRLERDELEFPDEVDCPVDSEARARFEKYRGLKNFVTAPWDALEDLPLEYGHLIKFQNYLAARKRVLADKSDGNGAVSGQYVRIHVAGVPLDMAKDMTQRPNLIAAGLHQYERQISVSHFKIRRRASAPIPIKSKTPLLIASGFRRFTSRPIFSQDTPGCDKHRVERYLQPNRYTIASCYSRIMFDHGPALFFDGDGRLVANGSHIGVNPGRLLIKRIVLTGYPIRIHKRRAVVRYMFFRPSDIRWFQPVQLSTKGGLVGQIDEPLGTHGYFKCSFNDMLKYNDTICMNLYKRQYPPWDASMFEGTL